MKIITGIMALFMAGCAGPLGLSLSSPAQLQNAYFYDVCDGWHVNHNPKLFDELRRRELFTPVELNNIRQNTVYVGMSMTAARCSWGTPRDEHTSNFGNGPTTQWVYGEYGGSYLYIRAEKVVAMQN